MVSLTDMLNKNKLSPANQESNGNGTGHDDSRDDGGISGSTDEKAVERITPAPEPVKIPPQSTASPAPVQTGKPLGGIKLGGLKLGGNRPAVAGVVPNVVGERPSIEHGNAGPPDKSELLGGTNDSSGASGQAPTTGLSLANIAGLGAGESQLGVDDSETGYLDQVPAEAPARKLPEELTAQQATFVKSLDSIYKLHSEPDLFVDIVSKIMSDLADNPALIEMLADEDSNAMIRGLRQSAGMAQVKKQESKAKRGTGRATKPNEKLDSAMATLQGLAGFAAFD